MSTKSKSNLLGEGQAQRDRAKVTSAGARGGGEPAAADAADVANYIAEIVVQLESMAAQSRLELLAYFLRLAQMEAHAAVRAARQPARAKSADHPGKAYSTGPE